MVRMTKGRFGFHRSGGEDEPGPAAAYVQIYVKSSALSLAPDLAISAKCSDSYAGARTIELTTRIDDQAVHST